MNPSFVAEALVKFQGKSVLVIGDVMLDRFVEGQVERISPLLVQVRIGIMD